MNLRILDKVPSLVSRKAACLAHRGITVTADGNVCWPETVVHCRRIQPGSTRSRSVALKALGGSDGVAEVAAGLPSFGNILDLVLSAGIVGSLVWSALPVIASSTESRRSEWEDKVWEKQDEAGVKWGVTSVVSFLPVFNWLAWVFAGLQNEERATFYYLLAALYAVPQLESGFQQTPFSVFTLIAGIAHVQIERIAEERDVQRDTPQLSESARDKPRQASKILGDSARGFAEVVDTAEQKQDIRDEVLRGKPSKRSKQEKLSDLRQWDERFRDK